MRNPRTRPGFTLTELLISMVLILMILTAVLLIFKQSADTSSIGEARIKVYDQSRKALDRIQTDLLGAVGFETGNQWFVLENGFSTKGGAPPRYGSRGNWEDHVKRAADRMQFRTIAPAGDTTQFLEVTYELVPYSDPDRKATSRTQRPLFVLMRRLRAENPKVPGSFVQARDSTGLPLEDEELVHFVTSFNIEYLANNGNFSQLDPSPCPPTDPLGNRSGKNDTGPTAIRIPQLRITLTVVDDVGERQERTVSRVFWIPSGN